MKLFCDYIYDGSEVSMFFRPFSASFLFFVAKSFLPLFFSVFICIFLVFPSSFFIKRFLLLFIPCFVPHFLIVSFIFFYKKFPSSFISVFLCSSCECLGLFFSVSSSFSEFPSSLLLFPSKF